MDDKKNLREKNNAARKRTYQKHKEKQAWYHFEWYAVNYHYQQYGHQVWHWENVPEIELYNAGFIHDYNKHRLKRLALRKTLDMEDESQSAYKNLHADIGFDGLIYDAEQDVYHGLQAKCWKDKTIRPNHLGSFYMKLFVLKNKNLNSLGYLYHTTKLSTVLYEDCQLENAIIAKHIDYDMPDDRSTKSIAEKRMRLYAHQKEAIKSLKRDKNSGLKLLSMICASGKTLVAGKRLAQVQPNLIICIAPLKLHVENLLKRIPPFIPDYEILLVDSDTSIGGTTDVDTITKFLNQDGQRILFTTYKSARDIMFEIMEPEHYQYILVDEVHNITPRKPKLAKFANNFPNGLLLTATPYKNLEHVINCKNVYSYTLQDGIRDKIVCDYRVWVPLCEAIGDDGISQVMCDIPEQFVNLDEELTKKSLFLCTGLLMTGSRKCIVYCNSVEECEKFKDTFQNILLTYHGLDCNIKLITQYTDAQERAEILQPFIKRMEHDMLIHIIVSIRIMDEAVDLPLCDSIFVTSVGESSSDIRMVQRLMRGGRMVKDNPCKMNNVFIWANDFASSLDVFALLKSTDAEFSNKISHLSVIYDKQDNKKIISKIDRDNQILSGNIGTKCCSLDEIWEIRRIGWLEYVTKNNGNFPSIYSKDNKIRSHNIWQNNQRKKYKSGTMSIDRINKLNATPYWKWDTNENWESNRLKWLKYVTTNNGKTPSENSKNDDVRFIGQWQSHQRKYYKDGKMSENRMAKLNATPYWKWDSGFDEKWESNRIKWLKYVNQNNGNIPSKDSKDTEIRSLGHWQSDQRKIYNSGKMQQDRIDTLNATPYWKWNSNLNERWKFKRSAWLEYVNKNNGKLPSDCSKDKYIRSLGQWQYDQRKHYKNKKMPQDRIDTLNATPYWKWSMDD